MRLPVSKTQLIVSLVIVVICVAAIVGGIIYGVPVYTPDPNAKPPPSNSTQRTFSAAAVSSDSLECSTVGSNILSYGGNAVDAAIATLLCQGLIQSQSMGIGGGFFMLYYDKETQMAYSINARETAPMNASKKMFHRNSDIAERGPLSIAVPGEISGYWEAHKRFGKLSWSILFEETIAMCKNGFKISAATANALNEDSGLVKNSTTLSALFVNPATGEVYQEGDIIKRPVLANTLATIAIEGADSFYTGTIAQQLLKDLQDLGSIITAEDLASYSAKVNNITSDDEPVLVTNITNGNYRLYSVYPPASGALVGFMYNILNGYNMTTSSISTDNDTITTLQRIVETFEFAYGQRTWLGDPTFDKNVANVVDNLTSVEFADYIRSLILDNSTSQNPFDYGAYPVNLDDHGTSHTSVLDQYGNAVSVTSTINLYFGSMLRSERTDIILNDEMDDFSSPGVYSAFDMPPFPRNHIEPGKRPLSSMSPSIFTDAETGEVRLITGAAGGTKITSAVVYQSLYYLWLGDDLKQSIDERRLHQQLFPMDVQYEPDYIPKYITGLSNIGHVCNNTGYGAVVNAISYDGSTITANADFRKGGDSAGF